VWSRPEIQELAARFVPATDEVWRLHHFDDPECQLFQGFMDEGMYRDRRDHPTRQGIYAVTPSGVLLADINTTQADAMRDMLRGALARWKELAKSERLLSYDPESRRAEIRRQEQWFPADGVAMRVYARDLPRGRVPADWRGKAWNLDYAWFRRDELRALLPQRVQKKVVKSWPEALVRRVARCHLTDYVRGQTTPHDVDHVHEASLTTEVVTVKKNEVELRFRGGVQICSGPWTEPPDGARTRGVSTTLLGRAIWDRRQDRFTQFELVAVGTRWGRTEYNFRQDDLAPSPIGWVFRLAPDGERLAPAALDEYGW